MKRLIGLVLLLVLIVSLSACTLISGKTGTKVERDVLIIGMKSGTSGFHPWMETYENPTMVINRAMYNGLVKFDGNLRVKPSLAVSWGNPDKNTWRFNLRQGVTFQNGYPFSASDVKFTIDLFKEDDQSKSALQDLLSEVKEVRVVNQYTVDIVTEKPNPVLLNKLAEILIISEKYHKETGSKPPIGTGPYELVDYAKGEYVEFRRFDNYWGGKLPAKRLVFKIIPDDIERTEALVNGKVDLTVQIPLAKIPELQDYDHINIVAIPTTRIIYLSFDVRENSPNINPGGINPLSILKVRKAMYHAINEEEIIDQVMDGLADPASQFVTKNIFGYNPRIKRLDFNLRKARILMEEAGYANGFDVVFDCPNDRYINGEEICERVVEHLARIKIRADLKAVTKSKFFPKVIRKESAFHLIGWGVATLDGGEIFNYILMTRDKAAGIGNYNHSFYSNAEVDRLGKESFETIDSERRLKIMQQGFKVAAEEVIWIPLHVQKMAYGLASHVNWYPRPDEEVRLDEISFK